MPPSRTPHSLALAALSVLLRTPMFAADFPIGLYGVPSDAPLEVLSAAGFNILIPTSREPGEQRRLALAAAKEGIDFIGHPEQTLRTVAAASWPVSAWYLADEPEVYRVSPADLERQSEKLRQWDPKRKVIVVVGDARFIQTYAASADELWVDWYPVPHLPLSSVGEQIGLATGTAGGKPVAAVIQAMDWRDYPQRDPKKPRVGRFPMRRELRFMAYHALVRGAKGLYFFEFQKRSRPGATLLDFPEQWSDLRDLTRELTTLQRFLRGAPEPWRALGLLEARSWRDGKKELLLLVNPTPDPQPLPESISQAGFGPLFERRFELMELLPKKVLAGFRALVLVRKL